MPLDIVFFGSGAFAVPALEWLAASPHRVRLVVTQPPRPAGRGRRTTPTPVAQAAARLHCPLIETPDVNDDPTASQIIDTGAVLGVVVAFGQKIGAAILNGLPRGCINIHASLLPRYRGAAPIQWAIIHGEHRTGLTVFRLTERMDAGPILVQRAVEIGPVETAGELHDRLAALGPEVLRESLALFEGGADPPGTPQDESRATRAPRLHKQDGWIRFDQPAEEVVRWIHGLNPWPGATCRCRDPESALTETVTLLRARPHGSDEAAPPAPGALHPARYWVAAQPGWVEILEIRPAGGRAMSWRDYVNGRRLSAAARFEALTETTTSRE